MRLTQHLTALRAWCKEYLPGGGKPDLFRPGIVGMRASMAIRIRPFMISSTPLPGVLAMPAWSVTTRRSVPTLWGCEGLWSYDYGHA